MAAKNEVSVKLIRNFKETETMCYYILIILMWTASNSLFSMELSKPFEEVSKQRMFGEKQQLFSRITEVARAEPNIVQSTLDQLDFFISTLNKESILCKELAVLKERFIQPEELIRSEMHFVMICFQAPVIARDHRALGPLVKLIDDIRQLIQREPQVERLLVPLKDHYERYCNAFFAAECKRGEHIHPKIFLTIESLGQTAQEDRH